MLCERAQDFIGLRYVEVALVEVSLFVGPFLLAVSNINTHDI